MSFGFFLTQILSGSLCLNKADHFTLLIGETQMCRTAKIRKEKEHLQRKQRNFVWQAFLLLQHRVTQSADSTQQEQHLATSPVLNLSVLVSSK